VTYPALGPRVVVGGVSGSGKTTLARELARLLGAPHIELDAHFHLAGWVQASAEQMAATVGAATAGETWVADGNYTRVRPVLWARVTTFVWLDYPKGIPTWRAFKRTIPRLVSRPELWNGNRESWRNLFDSGHPIWWSWHHHDVQRESYEEALADPAYAHVQVIRLRTPRETARWLQNVGVASGP
jgi:adenylate kinase family enzyme